MARTKTQTTRRTIEDELVDGEFEEMGSPGRDVDRPDREPDPELMRRGEAHLRQHTEKLAGSHGRASLRWLERKCAGQIEWAATAYVEEKGSFEHFLGRLFNKKTALLRKTFPKGNFGEELLDQRARAQAAASDKALVVHLQKTEATLRRLQKVATYWRVQGLADEDVRQQCILKLIEMLRNDAHFGEFERPGRSATLVVCRAVRDELRNERRVQRALQAQAQGGYEPPTTDHALELCLRVERAEVSRKALENVRWRLSRPQTQWFKVLRDAANDSSDIYPAALAEKLGKNRSTAARALEAIGQAVDACTAGYFSESA
jgi:hypothetical protein